MGSARGPQAERRHLAVVAHEESVAATPDGFRELARVPAITGRTWNHPVVDGDVFHFRFNV